MTELETLSQVADLGTAIATIVLVIIIWKTVAQLEETVKVSRIQITHRFRPWIGHQNKIELMSTDQDRHQFAITLRNYGEIPSSNLLASFISKTEPIPKELAKKSNSNTFNLGPLLPNMEKRYWFFVDSDLIQKAKDGKDQLFISLYFSYEHPTGKSGYGLVSHFDAKADAFVHNEMWLD